MTLAPTDQQEEKLHDDYRALSDSDHPSVRVTMTDVEEKFSSPSNDLNDRMISTVSNRSRSPARVVRDEGELQAQTSDQLLSHSWWGGDVARPKKKTEQTEALQSTRKVSNDNVISCWVSPSRTVLMSINECRL
jgi:hypothetical protein